MATAPLPIKEAIRLARAEGEAAFCERLGFGALVGTPPESGDPGGWSYHTRAIRGAFSRAAPGIDLKQSFVYALEKTQSRFADTLLIGRSESNDVRIDQDSISKLHARIRVTPGGMRITDAGSKNGIHVNYEPLLAEHALADGDTVTLGHFMFQFHLPAELYRMLRAAH
ncbi:MAG: FHA domain-containing protein [Deltaproteobacteria bacterium]|nr:FHA domain-containing protein [Deltaproteobacteria bacterium]